MTSKKTPEILEIPVWFILNPKPSEFLEGLSMHPKSKVPKYFGDQERHLVLVDEMNGDLRPDIPFVLVRPRPLKSPSSKPFRNPAFERKRKKNFDKDWSVVFQEAAEYLAKQDLTGDDHRVLWYVLGKIGFGNTLNLNQAKVAKELGKHRQHVNRSMRKLVGRGILVEGIPVGHGSLYSLNPNFGWRGNGGEHREARKAAPSLPSRRGEAKYPGTLRRSEPTT